MKITKFVHSCLLIETPDRTALFDPGVYSIDALDVEKLARLDDIFITHVHPDHCSAYLILQLVAKFPQVRITSNPEVVAELAKEGITAFTQPPEGVSFFQASHEEIVMGNKPENTGFHYLDKLTDPGDCHSFRETKQILALPITAPWGSTVRAFNLALELKPKYVLPIHDWHWNDKARADLYESFETMLGEPGITFFKLQTGQPIEINV